MGNASSNVTSGVKKQADTSSITCYELADLKGGGLLVDLMKAAAKTRNYSEVDDAIRKKVQPYLYNGGAGKMVHVAHMVINRNKDRPKHKMLYMLKSLDDPDSFNTEKWLEGKPEFQWSPDKDQSLFREVCWNLEQRGAVGESILHLCFLNSSSIHAELAKRLLRMYPKLINDYYVSEDYYGETVLHMAIVNEDPATLKFLLDNGANYHERCCGAFMSPEDQKASRTDCLTQEVVNVDPNTNYEGYVYWGEYPLSFAACLGQEECYRLILAKGADPNKQDTNGNTVLHLMVIHNKMEMFDLAYELGADLNIKNVLQLTPLTLAAKLAHAEMFDHIIKIQREIYWQLGGVVCAAYTLPQIDTIHPKNGGIQKNSVLNLVVFGDKEAHLDLMYGVLVDLLHAKWNTFVKARFYKQFFTFGLYFLISLLCFTLRPAPPLNNYSLATSAPVRNATGINRTATRIRNDGTSPLPFWTTLENVISTTDPPNVASSVEPRNLVEDSITAEGFLLPSTQIFHELNQTEDLNRGTLDTTGNSTPHLETPSTSQTTSVKAGIVGSVTYEYNTGTEVQYPETIKEGSGYPSSEPEIQLPENIPATEIMDTSTVYEVEGKATDHVFTEVQVKGDRVSLIAPRREKRALPRNRGNYVRSQSSTTDPPTTITDEFDFAVDTFGVDESAGFHGEFKYRKKKPGGFGKGTEEQNPEVVDQGKVDDYVYEYFDSVENDTAVPEGSDAVSERVTTPPPTTPHVELVTTLSPKKRRRFNDTDACRLWKVKTPAEYIRTGAEILVVVGAALYLLGAANEGWYLGRQMFIENLMTAPSRVLFLMSCWMTLGMVILRFLCMPRAEDTVAVLVMLSTGPYFLFFCRGFKKVGPFVVMIYRMIMGDLLRFVTIYAVFIMGFSQAYYILFLSYDNQDANPMPNAAESVMAMFLMSMNDFDSMFEAFAKTDHEYVAKTLFVIYMAIVAVLLVNLLIAMMGNTYTKISECKNEWQRQEDDKEEIEEIRELNLNHEKSLERKRKKMGSSSTMSAK